MSSFTSEQVGHFRQVFNLFNDEDLGGVTQPNFIPAVETSLQEANLPGPPPSHHYLNTEFLRICGDQGFMQWQQFFQVMIHLNNRQSASPPPTVQELPPPEHLGQSSGRVQFTGVEEEEIAPPSYDQVLQDDVTTDRGQTIGRQLLRSVGGFFGLTEASQRGNENVIGWQEFTERNLEDNANLFSTLSRRSSLRHRVHQPRPPSYPVTAGRSFDMAELGDDSDDEMGLTAAPPPMYGDVIGPSGIPDPVVVVHDQHYPEPTRSGPSRSGPSRSGPSRSGPSQQAAAARSPDMISDKTDAWNYYLKFAKAEKRLRQRRNHADAQDFFGSPDGEPVAIARSGSVRRERLNSREQVVRRPKRNKRTKLQRQSTLIRTEVESLPSFWPVFIILISVAQVVALIVLLALYRLAPIRISPLEQTEQFPSLLSTNESDPNITYFRGSNLWIGLTPHNLIQFGAKYSPCMRRDFGIRRTINARIADRTSDPGYGCCQNQDRIGNTLLQGCLARNFFNNSEIFFEPGTRCSSLNSSTTGANFHPCCISLTGRCEVMVFDECIARGGLFNADKESCDEVNCFFGICGFNGVSVGQGSDPVTGESNPLDPNPQQFWRFFTATYLHLGVIHILIIIPIQLYIGIKIERTIGWLRIGIIYTLSGVGGNLLSAIFIPYGVNAGASGALFGLLGVLYVELFQFWQIVDRAWLELIKLTAFVVFLLALGTLPYVDNMAHIGGLLFGVPAAIVFVPYITFGKWDAARKRILLVICVPLLVIMLLVGFLTFYLIPTPDFCSFCHFINCVPYTSNLCPEISDPDPEPFSF